MHAVHLQHHVLDRRHTFVGGLQLQCASGAGVLEAQGSVAKFVGGSAEIDGDTLDLEWRAVVADAGAGGHASGVGCGEQLRRQAIEMSARRADPDADGHWRLVEATEQHGHAIA